MRILQIHNKYLQKGGEDSVLENERKLLSDYGHEVEQLFFDNSSIQGIEKLKLLYKIVFNHNSAQVLKEKIKTFKPDIIHVHNFFYVASPAIFYEAKKQNIPIVLTLHNFRLICSGSLLLREGNVCELCVKKTFPLSGIQHKCFQNSLIKTAQLTLTTSLHKIWGTWKNKVDTYITLTHFIKDKFVHSSLDLNPDKLQVKPNFVEDLGFQGYDHRQNFFLFVGRLSKEKGIDVLLKATEKHNFSLEIIGGGEMQGLVEEYAQNNPNIVYHGFQQKDFIIEKMKSAKALIFPSVWYEGMPMTILESLSTGTPILISDIENLNQMITHLSNGLHFKTGNADDLAEKIKLFEKEQSEYFYVNARKTYLEHYTPEVNYQNLLSIYQDTIKKQ
jgi:glycosyltransferase involved in cell wall biosynthesis